MEIIDTEDEFIFLEQTCADCAYFYPTAPTLKDVCRFWVPTATANNQYGYLTHVSAEQIACGQFKLHPKYYWISKIKDDGVRIAPVDALPSVMQIQAEAKHASDPAPEPEPAYSSGFDYPVTLGHPSVSLESLLEVHQSVSEEIASRQRKLTEEADAAAIELATTGGVAPGQLPPITASLDAAVEPVQLELPFDGADNGAN